jgi:hypothetical protein
VATFEERQAKLKQLTDDNLIIYFVRSCRLFKDCYSFEKDWRRRDYQEAWAEVLERGLRERSEEAIKVDNEDRKIY